METDAFKKNERIWLGIKKLLLEEYITYGLKSIAKCVKKYFSPMQKFCNFQIYTSILDHMKTEESVI